MSDRFENAPAPWDAPGDSRRGDGPKRNARPPAAVDRTGALPPQNLDAERGVLGSLLLMNQAIDEVAEFLTADHFYSDRHRAIYAVILKLSESGARGIDLVTVADKLAQNGTLEDAGGLVYLDEVLGSVPHAAHAKYYAEIVREKAVQRNLIYACTEVLSECYDSSRPVEEVLQAAESRIFAIAEEQDGGDKIAIDEILQLAWDRIEERANSDGDTSGLPSGFLDLDRKTNGFQPAELIIVAARPSMGKTALVCNWAEAIAERTGKGVLLFSLEQSKLELAERFLCIRARGERPQAAGRGLRRRGAAPPDGRQRRAERDAAVHRRQAGPDGLADRGDRPAAEAAERPRGW